MATPFQTGEMDRLFELTVADVMCRQVICVSASSSMPEAADTLHREGVSCAPVVDDAGRCVGILSATDFVSRESRDEIPASGPNGRVFPADSVRAHMSTAVQSIRDQEPLLRAASHMTAGHLHRLVVLDETERPIGMLSTMDVVAALLGVIEEQVIADLNEK